LALYGFTLDGVRTDTIRILEEVTERYEGAHRNLIATLLDDVVVSAVYTSNEIHQYDLRTGKSWTSEIGGAWYRPIRWPTKAMTRVELRSWREQQTFLTKLLPIDSTKYVARFESWDEVGDRQYQYVIADTYGVTIAISEYTDIRIQGSRGSILYGVLEDGLGHADVIELEFRAVQVDSPL
jgi:hypothetical protein